MQKIPTIWMRNYDGDRRVRDEVTGGCEWFLRGEGVVTRKFDGTACLVKDGKLYKRYDAKHGRKPPKDFLPAQPEPDAVTGHWPGWIPVDFDLKENKWHESAWQFCGGKLGDWTYELIGPNIQGNPEKAEAHLFVLHGNVVVFNFPRTFEGVRAYFEKYPMEGVVVWETLTDQNCRKCKIKSRDFGIVWPRKA